MALEPPPHEDGCTCEWCNPHRCDSMERITHPERFEDEKPWIPTEEEALKYYEQLTGGYNGN